jgi:ParB/RepB/Spo0J family partition protein
MKIKKKTPTEIARSLPDRSPATGALVDRKPDEFKLIARTELEPDPDQPRKTSTKESLEQLAASIREQGIVQPLIVRFIPAKYKIEDKDLVNGEYHVRKLAADGHWDNAFQDESREACERFAGAQNLKGRYMIVAGERRWRAAELAGLSELPCVVRDVAGHKVFAQQFVENAQRENVSALEEAEALSRQLDHQRDAGPNQVEALAKEVGLSRAALYQRLALTRLHPPVREALLAGKISTSVAGVVAIVPLTNQQEKLLKTITNESAWHFPYSVRDVQELVERDYARQLKDAPFDQKVIYSESGAVQSYCTDCPHRSGNMANEFPELAKRPNICTRPDCFALKCKAYWQIEAVKRAEKGQVLMTEAQFKKVAKDYVPANDYCKASSGDYYTPRAKAIGRAKPAVTLVSTPEGLKEYFTREEAKTAANKNGIRFASDAPSAGESKKAKEDEARRKQREEASAVIVRIAAKKIEGAPWTEKREIGFWNHVFGRLEYHSLESWDVVAERRGLKGPSLDLVTKKLSLPEKRSFILEVLAADYLGDLVDADGYTDGFKEFCKIAGVDVKKEEEKFLAEKQKALPAPKAKKEQAELPSMGTAAFANKKAKIIAEQRARWARIKHAKATV